MQVKAGPGCIFLGGVDHQVADGVEFERRDLGGDVGRIASQPWLDLVRRDSAVRSGGSFGSGAAAVPASSVSSASSPCLRGGRLRPGCTVGLGGPGGFCRLFRRARRRCGLRLARAGLSFFATSLATGLVAALAAAGFSRPSWRQSLRVSRPMAPGSRCRPQPRQQRGERPSRPRFQFSLPGLSPWPGRLRRLGGRWFPCLHRLHLLVHLRFPSLVARVGHPVLPRRSSRLFGRLPLADPPSRLTAPPDVQVECVYLQFMATTSAHASLAPLQRQAVRNRRPKARRTWVSGPRTAQIRHPLS